MSNNIIELKFEQIETGYSVELRAGIEGKGSEVIINRTIPAFDRQKYEAYQQACRKLYDRHSRLGLKSTSVTICQISRPSPLNADYWGIWERQIGSPPSRVIRKVDLLRSSTALK